jgi:hypothetical protein
MTRHRRQHKPSTIGYHPLPLSTMSTLECVNVFTFTNLFVDGGILDFGGMGEERRTTGDGRPLFLMPLCTYVSCASCPERPATGDGMPLCPCALLGSDCCSYAPFAILACFSSRCPSRSLPTSQVGALVVRGPEVGRHKYEGFRSDLVGGGGWEGRLMVRSGRGIARVVFLRGPDVVGWGSMRDARRKASPRDYGIAPPT